MSEIKFTDELYDLLLVDGEEIWAGADQHLQHLGSGENASIYAHPEREDLVIRCSCFNDGWIRFADEIIRGEVVSPFVPKVFAIAHVSLGSDEFSDRWLSISERLAPIESLDPDAMAVAKAACRVMHRYKRGRANEQDVELLRSAHPGYVELAAQAPKHWGDTHDYDSYRGFDTREDARLNYMVRADGTVVVNDPIYVIDDETVECGGIAETLRDRYATGRQLSCPRAHRMAS
jgi:hypothetical protein